MHPISARTIRARARRDALRIQLGNRCVDCKAGGLLEFDVISPCDSSHHWTGTEERLRFYEAQAAAGNLALRCPRCHQRKSRLDMLRTRQRASYVVWWLSVTESRPGTALPI